MFQNRIMTLVRKNCARVCLLVTAAIASVGLELPSGAAESPEIRLARGNTTFACDFYQQSRGGDGNVVFSPYSLSSALAMTYTGARGQTATEMAATLHLNLPQADVPAVFAALNRRLATNGASKKVKLSVANSLWCQRDYTFTKQFQSVCREKFSAEIAPVDFQHATEAARIQINQWIAARTANMIREMLAPGNVSPTAKLILCNAIYFKGAWESPFQKEFTQTEDFFIKPDRKVRAPLMHRDASIRSIQFKTFDMFELSYSGRELSMVVLLPKAKDGLPRVEAQLSGTNLTTWLARLDRAANSRALIWLPKWKFEMKLEPVKSMEALGMKSAFTPAADFSGMTGKRDLQLSGVIHRAVVEVSEAGTEAAAATVVNVAPTPIPGQYKPPPPPPSFRADHPFIFLIRENRTGNILFLGRVTNPTK